MAQVRESGPEASDYDLTKAAKMEGSMSARQDLRVPSFTRLVREVDAGNFEHLECPACHEPAVGTWFTHPTDNEYRTWFLCSACDFQTRAQNIGKPKYFSEERRRIDLEQRDSASLKASLFKKQS
jgi:hypothetical protein